MAFIIWHFGLHTEPELPLLPPSVRVTVHATNRGAIACAKKSNSPCFHHRGECDESVLSQVVMEGLRGWGNWLAIRRLSVWILQAGGRLKGANVNSAQLLSLNCSEGKTKGEKRREEITQEMLLPISPINSLIWRSFALPITSSFRVQSRCIVGSVVSNVDHYLFHIWLVTPPNFIELPRGLLKGNGYLTESLLMITHYSQDSHILETCNKLVSQPKPTKNVLYPLFLRANYTWYLCIN